MSLKWCKGGSYLVATLMTVRHVLKSIGNFVNRFMTGLFRPLRAEGKRIKPSFPLGSMSSEVKMANYTVGELLAYLECYHLLGKIPLEWQGNKYVPARKLENPQAGIYRPDGSFVRGVIIKSDIDRALKHLNRRCRRAVWASCVQGEVLGDYRRIWRSEGLQEMVAFLNRVVKQNRDRRKEVT